MSMSGTITCQEALLLMEENRKMVPIFSAHSFIPSSFVYRLYTVFSRKYAIESIPDIQLRHKKFPKYCTWRKSQALWARKFPLMTKMSAILIHVKLNLRIHESYMSNMLWIQAHTTVFCLNMRLSGLPFI